MAGRCGMDAFRFKIGTSGRVLWTR